MRTLSLFLLCLLPLACAVPHGDYPSFSSPEERFSLQNGLLSVADTVVYKGGYVSVGGGGWQPITFAGEPYGASADWLAGGASLSLSSFSFPGDEESYVIVYSCSQTSGWDCHATTSQPDGFWQLFVISELTPPSETHFLVEDGVAQADIVVSPEAPNTVLFAADELQLRVADMTGATLPISDVPSQDYDFHVYVGQSTYTDALGVTDDGCEYGSFKMVSGDDHLVLLGSDDLQSVSGPHSKIGYWEVPEARAEWQSLTGEHWDTPYNIYYKDHNRQFEIWEADRRGTLNAVFEFLYEQGVRYYYPGDIGIITPQKDEMSVPSGLNEHVQPDFPMREFYQLHHKLFEASEDELRWQFSLRINPDEYTGRYMAHSLNYITSLSETKQEHPEYYAIWNGVRMNGDNFKQDLCSEGLYEQTVEFTRAVFDIYDLPVMTITPADGFSYASESSAECKAQETPERGIDGRLSDYVWGFVNRLAWEVYDEYPDKKVRCSAYAPYLLPPEDIDQFAPNVVVSITRWRGWFGEDPDEEQFYKDLTNAWLEKLPSKEVYIREYYLYGRPGGDWQSIPVYYPHIISEDLKWLKGKSKGEYMEVLRNSNSQGPEWDLFVATGLNLYVTARLYWDADQDVDLLLEEYYDLYYGSAAEEMQTFIEYSEANYGRATDDPEVLLNLRAMAEEARAVAGDTVYGERIDLLLGMMNSEYIGEQVTIDSCQTLDSPATTYKLTKDVTSTGTCFTIATDGVTLDCQGHTITYATTAGTSYYGVHINWENYFNITNCVIKNGNSLSGPGIFARDTTGGVIKDNDISSSSHGVYALNAHHLESLNIQVQGNTITSSSGVALYTNGMSNGSIRDNEMKGATDLGLYLYNTHDFIVDSNSFSSNTDNGAKVMESTRNRFTMNNFTSDSGNALYITQSSENAFIDNAAVSQEKNGIALYVGGDNTFIGQSASGGIKALYISGSSSNTFQDCGELVGGVQDSGTNNEFINCPY
ncbi:DUF4838 domain-containing protein [Candidatus Woesearchaeota archaeon]|nr:DUF4838 domain-containing protein [Candidatus Woesearchaeota archaeon]